MHEYKYQDKPLAFAAIPQIRTDFRKEVHRRLQPWLRWRVVDHFVYVCDKVRTLQVLRVQ